MTPTAPSARLGGRWRATRAAASLAAAAMVATACVRGATSHGPPAHPSSRIARLARELARGEHVVDQFWRETAGHAPLVEMLPGVRDTVLVTYVWRGDGTTTGVSLSGGMPGECGEKALRRLPGSDVWYRSEHTPAGARFSYRFRVNAPTGAPRSYADIAARETQYPTRPDPLNGESHPLDGSMLRLDSAAGRAAGPGAAQPLRGRLKDSTVTSAALKGARPVWIYTPPGFDHAATYPLLVVLDGRVGTNGLRIPALLEALVERGAVAPTVAVFIGNPNPLVRAQDYMGSEEYTTFLTEELVPLMRARYAVDSAAARHAIIGVSLGGLAATYAAHMRPDRFGAVVSLSGAHWYRPGWRDAPHPITDAEGWLTRRIAASPRQPIRIFLAAGALESRCPYPYLAANRRLAEVLRSRGYESRWVEYAGGHDVENWLAQMPAALEFVLGPHP